MKAAIYCRVSTTEQATEGHSIAAQARLLNEYATKQKWAIVATYKDEGASAKTADRPQFQSMIAAAKQKPRPFDVILIHKYDRFARNREDSIVYKNLLRRECDVEVVSMTEPTDDSPVSKLMEGILEVMNEFYLLNLSAEVKKGMTEAASNGRALGMAPFGYRVEDGFFVVEPSEAKVVAWIYETYANTDKGTREIAKILRFHGEDMFGKVAKKHRWSQPGITNILRNTSYLGERTWGKRDVSKNRRIRPEEDWIVAENAMQAIVSDELFQTVQTQLDSKKSQRAPSEDYLLRGLVKCADCGSAMSQFRTSWKRKSGEKIWGELRLMCNNYRNSGECSVNSVSAKEVELSVIDSLRELIEGRVEVSDLNIVFESDGSLKNRVAELQAKLKSFDSRFARQMEAYEAGVLDLQELAKFKERLNGEKEGVSKELADSENTALQLSAGVDVIRKRAKKLMDTLDGDDLGAKKAALSSVVHHMEYSREQDGLNVVLRA